jgi:hypothetical protein
MLDSETDLLRENPPWLTVLQAYVAVFDELAAEDAASDKPGAPQPETDCEAEIAADTADDESSEDDVDASETGNSENPKTRRRQPWAPRLTAVDGVEADDLSKIHGRLIAYGLLKCDLADRAAGVVYQLTTEARRALEALAVPQAEDESIDDGDQELTRSA